MRKDIDKVIVERPRRGSRTEESGDEGHHRKMKGKYVDADQYTDLESLPTKEAMNRYHKTKDLNENLAPLKRFLEKSVGRPWDKVYSELSEQIDLSSTVKRHIWQHVWDFVIKDTFIDEDGKIRGTHGGASFYSKQHNLLEDMGIDLYVHPTDGLLKKVKRPKGWEPVWKRYIGRYYPEKEKDYEERIDVGDLQFRKKKGIWYVIELRKIPEGLSQKVEFNEEELTLPTKDGSIKDICIGVMLFSLYDEEKKEEKRVGYWVKNEKGRLTDRADTLSSYYGRKGVYGAKYKQANSKELKAAGLRNDPPQEE